MIGRAVLQSAMLQLTTNLQHLFGMSLTLRWLMQLKGVLDRIVSDESDMKAIHLTGR